MLGLTGWIEKEKKSPEDNETRVFIVATSLMGACFVNCQKTKFTIRLGAQSLNMRESKSEFYISYGGESVAKRKVT